MKLWMKCFLLIGIFSLLSAFPVQAKTMYVNDTIKLPLRTGPTSEYKILAFIESGQPVEVLEEGDQWTLIQLSNGKQGWVMTRYLTSEETDNIKLERLEKEYQHLKAQSDAVFAENAALKAENQKLSSQLTTTNKALNQYRTDYETLKSDSAEFLSLKSKYEKAAVQLDEQTQKANKLEEQVSKLEFHSYIKWFLAGSGVLMLGFIVGFSTKRQRRRPSLL